MVLRSRERSVVLWETEVFRYFAFLALVLLAALIIFVALCLYEWAVLGEHQLGMRKPPFVTPYYLGRLAAAFLLSLLIAPGVYSLRSGEAAIHHSTITARERHVAFGLLAAAACTALFVVDPLLFNELALEDNSLEWLSALLPMLASGAFVHAFIKVRRSSQRDVRRRVALLLSPLFALALFILGMEEISWMQRIFGFKTPAWLAENQQDEINLHNMHSIVIGQALKGTIFAALVVLPFIVDTAPRNRLFDLFADFQPSRFILAVSAPWVAFNYNEWNFIGSQMAVTLTLVILACYLRAAWVRRDSKEMALFGAIAVFVMLAQPLFLALGHNFVRRWDASEYVEFFIAIGLTLFTWEATARLRARYGAAAVRHADLDNRAA